jgi:hypothetical protein
LTWFASTCDSSRSTRAENQKLFNDTLQEVFHSLGAGGLKRVLDRVKDWNFRNTIEEMIVLHMRVGGNNPTRKKIAAFLYVHPGESKAEVVLDGGKESGEIREHSPERTIAETYRHEIAHIIDGVVEPRVSSTRAWRQAWRAEIDDYIRKPLTKHSLENAQEGFAEFGRQILSDKAYAKKHFPLCYAVWKEHHLV